MASPDARLLAAAYAGKRILVTGHTGFKGGWLAVWLKSLGAEVTGLALAPSTEPSLFEDAGVAEGCRHLLGDIRDPGVVHAAVRESRPDAIFHLAAQSLVRLSYDEPVETVATNVMGTAHVLEAVRLERRPCAAVIVTSDKCYENREWDLAYRESDPMGGHDLYSTSKGAAELVTQAYRRSFFPAAKLAAHGVAVASARAGNVIGGGDWAKDRIVPDAIRALTAGTPIPVRNPRSVRPWQHVLEPLGGYLLLGAGLLGQLGDAQAYCDAWNFGPLTRDAQPVAALVGELVAAWGEGSWVDAHQPDAPHEAGLLRLAIDRASARLGWSPRWDLRTTARHTAAWYRARQRGAGPAALRALMLEQIAAYLATPA